MHFPLGIITRLLLRSVLVKANIYQVPGGCYTLNFQHTLKRICGNDQFETVSFENRRVDVWTRIMQSEDIGHCFTSCLADFKCIGFDRPKSQNLCNFYYLEHFEHRSFDSEFTQYLLRCCGKVFDPPISSSNPHKYKLLRMK